ncbi:MAG: lipoyl(octanoyl) transferase LipB [Nitriliruptoraceae bacterium]
MTTCIANQAQPDRCVTGTEPPNRDRLRAATSDPVTVVRPGLVPYLEAFALQHRLVDARRDDRIGDTLLLLEHPAVYTMGKRTDRANLIWDANQRRAHDIDLVEVDRGGDVTYHGPGQLVGYPILRLASIRSVVDYVRALEDVIIDALAAVGIPGQRSQGFTGVWVGDRKIAAIGVRVASGAITSHGFALNVTTHLDDFAGIVPCGIADRGVCSIASLGVSTDVATITRHVSTAFAQRFDATLDAAGLADIDPPAPGHNPLGAREPLPT